mmetsp:Transcript_19272/g.21460  ORF Transcript_19272/g.21460 Transcript_19272/m.21460 type:complete len:206 (+) Transcript_19272:149-766(+)
MSSKVDVKVVLLGMHSVGKTSLVERYLQGKFNENVTATVGAAFGAKRIHLKTGGMVTLGIWDTAGAERYESMSRIYYRSAKAAVICFDLTNAASFAKVKNWAEELRSNEKQCKLYIAGTKADLLGDGRARGVEQNVVEEFANAEGAKYFETSAKKGVNVEDVFLEIAADWASVPANTARKASTPTDTYSLDNKREASGDNSECPC